MTKRRLAILTVAAALTLGAPALMADHDGDRDDGHKRGHGHGQSHGRGNKRADRSDRDGDERGWERRGNYEYRTYERDGRPPGWSQGRKTGWGNCGLPPGQAKKYGCYAYNYQGRNHYYYRDEVGRIIVRRPVVEVYGGVVVR
jgi:hypothetical protein